jgi:hypothetical protein
MWNNKTGYICIRVRRNFTEVPSDCTDMPAEVRQDVGGEGGGTGRTGRSKFHGPFFTGGPGVPGAVAWLGLWWDLIPRRLDCLQASCNRASVLPGRIQLSLHPAPTGRIQQGSPSCSNREDTAGLSILLQHGDTEGLSLLLRQEG